jgi:NAD(P)-dependent dehydrogenase (short-subunit alcohol dehydrogenase family)
MRDRVVFITGAKGGLGSYITRRFLATGTTVVGASRSISQRDFPEPNFTALAVNFTTAAAVRDAVQSVITRFGRLDALVHLLGGFAGGQTVAETDPGNGKVHRDCAVRCLRGGIPPVFATNDFNGSPAVLLLTGPNQKPLPKEAFLDRVAQPVRIHGRVLQTGNTLLLETESSAISSHCFRHPHEQGR